MKLSLQHFWPFAKKPDPSSAAQQEMPFSARILPTDQDLVRAGALLTKEKNFKSLISVFVEQSQDISRVDMAAFYIPKDSEEEKKRFQAVLQKRKISRAGNYFRLMRTCCFYARLPRSCNF
jgi:hypothetical protein